MEQRYTNLQNNKTLSKNKLYILCSFIFRVINLSVVILLLIYFSFHSVIFTLGRNESGVAARMREYI